MTAMLTGTVLDARGLAAPGASVAITNATTAFKDIAALTDAGGQFVFDGLSEGFYELEARGTDGFLGRREIAVFDHAVNELTITLTASVEEAPVSYDPAAADTLDATASDLLDDLEDRDVSERPRTPGDRPLASPDCDTAPPDRPVKKSVQRRSRQTRPGTGRARRGD